MNEDGIYELDEQARKIPCCEYDYNPDGYDEDYDEGYENGKL
jgi:hypothetical protein